MACFEPVCEREVASIGGRSRRLHRPRGFREDPGAPHRFPSHAFAHTNLRGFIRTILSTQACAVQLNRTDDEFWIADQPNGYQHTGLWGSEHGPRGVENEGASWNTSELSAFTVLAQTESDFQETVKFATKHNLRLVVKATGHDWYGRSYAPGSLVLWTHQRKEITWHDAFVPAGATSKGVPAVTVESGVQFSDLYPAAQMTPYPNDPVGRMSIVMGGTCDSVGVGGCWLGGCYGPFTKLFGNGAVNLLEANVVLANGTLVTCSESQHPDLFWTLRGGGGGNTGVVTQFTARTHPAPQYTISSGFNCRGKDMAGFAACAKHVLKSSSAAMSWSSAPGVQDCGGGGPSFDAGSFSAGFGCGLQWEGDANRTAKLYDPLVAWCEQPAQKALQLTCSSYSSINWKQSDYTSPTDRKYPTPEYPDLHWMPWIELKPDREISTRMLGSLTKYFPMAVRFKLCRCALLGQVELEAWRVDVAGRHGHGERPRVYNRRSYQDRCDLAEHVRLVAFHELHYGCKGSVWNAGCDWYACGICAAVLSAPKAKYDVLCSRGLTAGDVMLQWRGSTTQPKIPSC